MKTIQKGCIRELIPYQSRRDKILQDATENNIHRIHVTTV